MPDIDVAVVGLTSPTNPAYLTPYRPAVLMRNAGIVDVVASGTVSIYNKTTGLLVRTFAVASAIIPPGEQKEAIAGEYWTPPEVGDYFASGTISCPGDQIPVNNILNPSFFTVTDEPPPPPPTVPNHAEQHEQGGADELVVDDLSGVLAEPQTPATHHATHEPGGTDELTAIVPADHATTHEVGGSDLMNIGGLHGLAADPQTPVNHASSYHDATVEATANKGAASGYCPLNSDSQVPYENLALARGKILYYASPGDSFQIEESTVVVDVVIPWDESPALLRASALYRIESSNLASPSISIDPTTLGTAAFRNLPVPATPFDSAIGAWGIWAVPEDTTSINIKVRLDPDGFNTTFSVIGVLIEALRSLA